MKSWGGNFSTVVGFRIYPPYLSRKAGVDGSVMSGNNAFEGYAMDLMDGICKLYECNYAFELVPDNNYGKYDPKTKEWNGLIRHLLDRVSRLFMLGGFSSRIVSRKPT